MIIFYDKEVKNYYMSCTLLITKQREDIIIIFIFIFEKQREDIILL